MRTWPNLLCLERSPRASNHHVRNTGFRCGYVTRGGAACEKPPVATTAFYFLRSGISTRRSSGAVRNALVFLARGGRGASHGPAGRDGDSFVQFSGGVAAVSPVL